MGMSKLLINDSLKYYLTGETVFTRPSGWEISLHTGDPGDDGTDNEVTDSTYTRQSIEFEISVSGEGDSSAQNALLVVFPAAADSYTVTHIVVWGDQSNPLVMQPLRSPKTIVASEQAQIAPGEIKIGAL